MSSSEAANLFASGDSVSTAITVTDDITAAEVDIEDLDPEKVLEVNSAIAVEKEIAADTIGTIFAATGSHFLPFVEQCTLELVALLPHYYEGIRKSATESLLQIIRTFYKLSDPQEWQAGQNIVSVQQQFWIYLSHQRQQVVPLHQNVKDLINLALPALLEMYESEDDK